MRLHDNKRRNGKRADSGRPRVGKMVPHGAASMTDEEFWAICEQTRPTYDSIANRNRGAVRHGAFPHAATSTHADRTGERKGVRYDGL